MSPRSTRLILWVAAFVALPVVYFIPEGESAPALRLAFLFGLMSAVFTSESPGPLLSIWLIALAQLLLWSALLYLGARIASGLLASFSDPARRVVTFALVFALLGLSCMEIYDTPLSSARLRSNIFGIFQ